MSRRLATIALVFLVAAATGCNRDVLVIEDFEGDLVWTALPADGVELNLSREARSDGQGHSLRLDYAFGGGGYAIARLETELELRGNYAFRFQIRGDGPRNNLEFKLVDPSGENVWWKVRRDVEWPAQWQTFRIKQHQLEFAWGPQGGGEVAQVGAIEFAITAGQGGTGTVWLDDLELVPLPPTDATPPDPRAGASSSLAAHAPALVLDDDPNTAWSPAAEDIEPTVWLDLRQRREYGALVVVWAPDRGVPDYHLEASDDGKAWRLLRTVTGSNGGRDYHFLPEGESRFLRVRFAAPATGQAAISGLQLKPVSWSVSREAFYLAIAKGVSRGLMPRGFCDEQVYWTVVGVDADSQEGLLSEDGALEAGIGRFSVEPFLFVDGGLVTWNDVVREQALQDHDLPLPSVTWVHDGPGRDDLRLRIRALAWGEAENSSLLGRYELENLGDRAREVALFLAVRPFQVNPPSQTLNQMGGTSPIGHIEKRGDRIVIDGRTAVVVPTVPDGFGATTFFGGEIVVDYLRKGVLPPAAAVDDPFDAASAALAYRWTLAPQTKNAVDLVLPLHDYVPAAVDFDVVEYAVSEGWRDVINQVTLTGPPAATETIQTLKAQLGYILVNRSGAGIQPGARSYARSWIRDGALTSWALLRMGLTEPAREFLEWYAPHQYDNGKIPCVVDHRGADPVPEHDSSGEFIFLVAQVYRYTGDRDLLQKMWPRVLRAANYLDRLRQQRRTSEYLKPPLAHFYGLLPPSISHEGYSAKPMHSYWDDFFALRGFKDAVALAETLGHDVERRRLATILSEFESDLGASVAKTMAVHEIDYVAGCADLGDFDATSTTIALSPADARDILPAESLERTFERYYHFFLERAAGAPWDAFTPYEVRNIGAFVRLGWRARANQLRDFFLAYRRPPGWRQWAEVVFRNERDAHFVGDMPHTWVGSDFIRSVLDMFVYERGSTADQTDELVLAAGLPAEWLEEGGVSIGGLPTPYGELSYTLVREGDSVVMEIEAGVAIPAGGLIVDPPLPVMVTEAVVNGRTETFVAQTKVVIESVPARVVWQ